MWSKHEKKKMKSMKISEKLKSVKANNEAREWKKQWYLKYQKSKKMISMKKIIAEEKKKKNKIVWRASENEKASK